jgi:hypothetical protein
MTIQRVAPGRKPDYSARDRIFELMLSGPLSLKEIQDRLAEEGIHLSYSKLQRMHRAIDLTNSRSGPAGVYAMTAKDFQIYSKK